ncbi:LuxR C-terminal-related transcriptional regulator [Streptomyces sp. NPDC006339]|uniref:helix-turn-helix transcriptional regulator n=1 Tax=Streptomyces sp. NPDC006339 TaxID=3156755 RepID=UPI0033A32C6F
MQTYNPATVGQPLTAEEQVAYKAIAAGGDADEKSTQRLAEEGLIVPDPYAPGRWVAMDPRAVAQRLLADEQETLARSLERMRQVPVIEGLAAHFDAHRLYGGPGSEFLPTMAQVNDRLGAVSTLATKEICTVQPAPPAERSAEVKRLGSDRSIALLQSGRVGMRLVYGIGALADEATRRYADAFIAAGGQIKVSAAREQRLIIVDQDSLFVDDYVLEGTESHSGWHIRDRATIAWAKAAFDRLWERARWWSEALAEAGDIRLSPRQLDILGLFDAGLDSRAAAKELGVSPRTVATELTEAKSALGVTTTYQLMAWYGRWAARAKA